MTSHAESGRPGRVTVFQKSITSLDFLMATEFVFREARTEFLYIVHLNFDPQKDKGVELVLLTIPPGYSLSKCHRNLYIRVYYSNVCFYVRK